MAVLVKGKMILTSGFVRVSNGAIIPAALVKLLSDAAEPVLVDQVEMAKAIGTAITSARVELLTTDDIDNMKTNYDAFIKANKQNQHDQYSTIDIKYIGTDELYLNPPVVESYLFDGQDYIKLSQSIELRDLADTLLNELVFKADSDEVLLLNGSQQMDPGYIPQNDLDVEVVESVVAKMAALKSEINGVESTRDQTQQDEILNLFEDERADFVRVQDLVGAIEIVADIAPTESGADVTLNISGLDLAALVNERLTTFKLDPITGQGDSIYIRDSYNNATSTPNTILGTETSVITTTQLVTISGLSNAERTTITNDYKLILVSQVNSNVGANIDAVARAAVAKETADRIASYGKLQSKTITNAIDGLTSVEAILKANNDLIKANYKELSEDGKIKNAAGTRDIIIPEKKGTLTIEDDVFLKTDYEEKEITITPAIYGWVKPDYTKPAEISKWKNNKFRLNIDESSNFVTQNSSFYQTKSSTTTFTEITFPNSLLDSTLTLNSAFPNNIYFDNNAIPTDEKNFYEIWDIITPAVKAIVLVKK